MEPWTPPGILTAELRNLLPFCQVLFHDTFHFFIDNLLTHVVHQSIRQLHYLGLSGRSTPDGQPIEILIFCTREETFWTREVPRVRNEIFANLEFEDRVYYLDSFSVDYQRIELRFNEIRAIPTTDNQYRLVLCDGKELVYKFTVGYWETTLTNPDPRLLDPIEFSIPAHRNPNPTFVPAASRHRDLTDPVFLPASPPEENESIPALTSTGPTEDSTSTGESATDTIEVVRIVTLGAGLGWRNLLLGADLPRGIWQKGQYKSGYIVG